VFGFEASVGLEDGLRETIAWQVQRRAVLAQQTVLGATSAAAEREPVGA
jgi:hypothetical protein